MISFEKFELDNGLQVVVHEDPGSPTVCLNILYKVGSRNEIPGKTGFAHFFEHLMFGGSKHISAFDEELQAVGGDNNAFTNTDITNYYTTVPAMNMETAFWLESDRMLNLSFDPRVLEVQRNVVIEEFKQRYLNQPYGDIWHKLRPSIYTEHPYRWPTIGESISHIEEATMDDVKDFFAKFYGPENAILVVAGQVTLGEVKKLTKKWFGPVPSKNHQDGIIGSEPEQKESRKVYVSAKVPQNAIYKAYRMGRRTDESYHSADLLSDLLGRGDSSWLYHELVKENELFTGISASVMGTYDPGILTISGKLNQGISFDQAERGIEQVFGNLDADFSSDLNKVQNMAESTMVFGEVDLLNRAMALAYATFLGNTNLVNVEMDMMRSVTVDQLRESAAQILKSSNCTTLYYEKK